MRCLGREPWSSRYGWRLKFEWSWVWIPAPYTGWTFGNFFTLICCKNCIVCLKRPKTNKKEAGVAHFYKKTTCSSISNERIFPFQTSYLLQTCFTFYILNFSCFYVTLVKHFFVFAARFRENNPVRNIVLNICLINSSRAAN